MPGVAELTIKHRIEPMLVFALGTLMIGPCKSLGLYWMAAGICMAANGVSIEAAEREQVNDMTDAFLDQRRLAEKLRERMRD